MEEATMQDWEMDEYIDALWRMGCNFEFTASRMKEMIDEHKRNGTDNGKYAKNARLILQRLNKELGR